MHAWLESTLKRDVDDMVIHLGARGFNADVIRALINNPRRNANRRFLLIILSKWMRCYNVTF